MTDLIIADSGIHAKAELDVQITTAKAYPRNQRSFIEDAIMLATLDQETAESCFYCLVRKGKDGKSEIKGPSIRLAEIAASCWGNVHAASRIIENDGKFVTAQGICWDLEKNVKMSSELKRSITKADGSRYSSEMQGVTSNAACSIALRNAIFKVIPKALIDRVYEAAIKFSVGDQKTLNAKRQSTFARLNRMGVETNKILGFYGKNSIEEFDEKDVAELIGTGTAIKDGMISIDKAFTLDLIESDNPTEDRLKQLTEQK